MLAGWLLVLTAIYVVYNLLRHKLPKNFPPGPQNFPIVGAALQVSKLATTGYGAFLKLGEIYGPVTGLYLGNNRTVIINGYEATKEFYARDEFPDRPHFFTFGYPWGGRMLGIFFSSGRLWQEQRRFTLRHLRDFGFGKTSMECLIQEEAAQCIEYMIKALKESHSQTITVHDRFGVSMVNILWVIVAGQRYRYDDQEFKVLLKVIQEMFRTGSLRGNFVNTYPFLRHFPHFKKEFEALTSAPQAIFKILQTTIDNHEKSRDPNSPRDLIDVYLQAMEENKHDVNTTFFREQLMQTCVDFFSAGSESTSNSVAFAVLHMIRNPRCQQKVQEELDAVVGRDRFPSYCDREKLPYTYAVITESLRITPIAPVSVPHANNNEDVTFMDFTIPKGTWVMINFPAINMNKVYWEDPENFRPERFLDNDGKFIKSKLDYVAGFGGGRRACGGESLARLCNFGLFTAVMQRLKFEKVPGTPEPSIEPIDGFTVAPQPFSAKMTIRY